MMAQASLLVAADRSVSFDELGPVVELARTARWRIDLLCVAPPESAFVGSDDLGGLLDPDARRAQLAADAKHLRALVERLSAEGLVADSHVVEGSTVEAILDQAEGFESAMIVLVGRTKKVADRLMHGSTVSSLLKLSPRPVIILPSGDEHATVGGFRSSLEGLSDALEKFETDHPALTKAINDVSYYLSGMGI